MDNFHNTLDYALETLGKSERFLKESLYETMKNLVCNSMDTIFPATKIRRVDDEMIGNETVFEQPDFLFATAGQRSNDSGSEINMVATARVIYFAPSCVD